MELDLRLGNDPPPSSHPTPTPLHFSLSFSSIHHLQHQTHNHLPHNHLLLHSLNSPPPPAASRPSSQTEGSGGGVFTEVISGATAVAGDGGGEMGGRSSKGIVWSIRNNKREEEREGKSENEEEEEEEEEMNVNMISSGSKKLRLSRQQSAFLEESFKQHHILYPKQKVEVARRLNLRPRQVEVWFQNRRARTKLKQNEVECEYLKKCCATLTQQNTKLHKELQDLRALKTTHSLFINSPPTTLTLCASCQRPVANPNSRSTTTLPPPPPLSFSPPQLTI